MTENTENKQKFCFVIGPIGEEGSEWRRHADMILNNLIRHTLVAAPFNYSVERADDSDNPGMISHQMISDLKRSDLIIADLTFHSANAFWELGVAHAWQKKTINIAAQGTTIPFDNHDLRTIFVDLGDWQSLENARSQLKKYIQRIEDDDYKVTNPITQANALWTLLSSEDTKDQILAQQMDEIESLKGRLHSLETNIRSNPAIGTGLLGYPSGLGYPNRPGSAFEGIMGIKPSNLYPSHATILTGEVPIPTEAKSTLTNTSKPADSKNETEEEK